MTQAISTLRAKEKELQDALRGKTIEQINLDLESVNKKIEQDVAIETLTQLAAMLLSGQNGGEQPTECPVCHLQLGKDIVLRILHESEEDNSGEATGLIGEQNRLKALVDSIITLQGSISAQTKIVKSYQIDIQSRETQLASLLNIAKGIDLPSEATKRIETLEHKIAILKSQIEDAKEADRLRRNTLAKLQDEVRLHHLLSQHRELKAKQEELQRAKDSLGSLSELQETSSKICEALQYGLVTELKNLLGPVDKALSESFIALTQHPAYDRVFVDQELLPNLELKVGSTEDPRRKWDDAVLNGQAASALGLVPYFAFSQLTDMPFEVHVMLLDDPTQSFDRAHIETLVAKLAQVGQKVQLILSSHELETFKEFIPKYFDVNSYRTVELTKYSIKDGPKL